jgi:hypothetical protein
MIKKKDKWVNNDLMLLRKCRVTLALLIQTQMTFTFAQLSSSRQETATDLYRKSRIFHLFLLYWHYGVCQSIAMSLSFLSTCWKSDRRLKEKLILVLCFVCHTDRISRKAVCVVGEVWSWGWGQKEKGLWLHVLCKYSPIHQCHNLNIL